MLPRLARSLTILFLFFEIGILSSLIWDLPFRGLISSVPALMVILTLNSVAAMLWFTWPRRSKNYKLLQRRKGRFALVKNLSPLSKA